MTYLHDGPIGMLCIKRARLLFLPSFLQLVEMAQENPTFSKVSAQILSALGCFGIPSLEHTLMYHKCLLTFLFFLQRSDLCWARAM